MRGKIAERDYPKRAFPELYRWVIKHGSINSFCEGAGISKQTYYDMMYWKTNPTYKTIRKILAYTGGSFEKMFKEAEHG